MSGQSLAHHAIACMQVPPVTPPPVYIFQAFSDGEGIERSGVFQPLPPVHLERTNPPDINCFPAGQYAFDSINLPHALLPFTISNAVILPLAAHTPDWH
ncbi:TPA: hypothetical protein G8N56_003988 [Salmonella enterica]|nr:hypothetical protein [Salmonella enterica]